MKISSLLERDLKIVEKRKVCFIVPLCIAIVALIMGTVYGFWLGSPFNLGMDFTGGYSLNVKLATKLSKENYNDYVKQIEEIFENLTNDEGENYGVRVASTQHQGEDESASIYVRYQAVKTSSDVDTDALMEDVINVKLQEKLSQLLKIAPQNLVYESGVVKISYLENITEPVLESIKENATIFADSNNISMDINNMSRLDTDKTIVLLPADATIQDKLYELKAALAIDDGFSSTVELGTTISATVSGELLVNATLAVILALVLMLLYIAFRFELVSGIATILGLIHDLIIMFATVVIFRLEINASFIAALITILGYSINNTIIVFDRVRENSKLAKNKNLPASDLVNKSVTETLMRSINTSITTLITITMVAIIGVPSIRVFIFPIILGLLAGTYSSIFIVPSIWAMIKGRTSKKKGQKIEASGVQST